MAEERLRSNLDRAFDAGAEFPDRLLLSRTMAALGRSTASPVRPARPNLKPSSRTMGVLAAAIVVALLAAASGVFLAVNDFTHRAAPAGRPPLRPATAVGLVAGLSAASANDAAVWGPYNFMKANRPTPEPLDSSGLLITHDGGKTWLATGIGSPTAQSDGLGYMGSVSWTDAEHLAVVDNDSIRVTSDGGLTWHQLKNPAPFSPAGADSLNEYRVSGSTIFLSGISGHLLTSHDSGTTWIDAVLPPPPGGWQTGMDYQYSGPFMFGLRGVFGVAQSSDTLIYSTADGGKSWSGPITERGQSLWALGPSDWWIVKPSGQVARTLDGGANWFTTSITPNYSVISLTSIFPTGGNVLWAVANMALPLRSTDGGAHWSIVKLP